MTYPPTTPVGFDWVQPMGLGLGPLQYFYACAYLVRLRHTPK